MRAVGATLALPTALAALWWVTSADSGNVFLPPLRDILDAFGRVWFSDVLIDDVLPSLRRLATGYGAALALGVPVGYLIGRSPLLGALVNPVLGYLRALPPPVIIPVLLVAVGIGETTKIVVIAFGALWPILLNTADGVRAVDEVALETAAVYRLPAWTRRRLVLRAASPRIFAGARQALGLAIILMVVSEMLMSTDGLGFTVVRFQRSFALPEMWSGVLLIGLLGFVLAKLFERVERHALRWHRGLTGRQEGPS
ncbi:ABC transporter permease [Streptomyces sp. DSM 44915]|uniref:ABC transporter permease n=1 Tax=Streptomyces chisholmiae TaxID=3075540 RepID=A0ABU2JP77_9ACTN|nr:ABC transporter permease [Streptomyces sp. DSM 44915]MDT0266707.1 ABC transporter permease [Streptomyces sp. DSM 44915]